MVKANERLARMTGGQYELKHDDGLRGNAMAGLGIQVLDNWTGLTRESQSLSGGETFLASMALAFGLAEVVSENAGGIQLDTLFMDEGFAALDNEILDTAMNTLQDLRATGRTIGLISHVGPMKEQIPNKIHVAKGNDGTSVITVHHG
jgi:exonuclease SbcC